MQVLQCVHELMPGSLGAESIYCRTPAHMAALHGQIKACDACMKHTPIRNPTPDPTIYRHCDAYIS